MNDETANLVTQKSWRRHPEAYMLEKMPSVFFFLRPSDNELGPTNLVAYHAR